MIRAHRREIALAVLLLIVLLVYSRHFNNEFHFDDVHTVLQNPYIRDLHKTPQFFTDSRTFSILPRNRGYRPLVTTSLAIDYWLGGGLAPFYFQLSTFCWFLVQLVLMFALFRKIFDAARPSPRNWLVALLATAWYGLHPAMAETVNYIIQRGDLYSTLGVIAAILAYAAAPNLRKFGIYLLPAAAALLSKPPALVFPALLLAYVLLFEEEDTPGRVRRALVRSIPAFLFTTAFGFLQSAMTPKEFDPGVVSAYAYRITQPLVALRYFRTFIMPGGLTADTDLAPIASIWKDWAWIGFLFVIAVVAVATVCSKKREWRPVAFGLWWFLLALVPTSIFPLGEVENDHRMFFPFVGLVLSASWVAALFIYHIAPLRRVVAVGLAVVCFFELATLGLGTIHRNLVWHTEESLWHDVAIKSPLNARGLMNYGNTLARKGDYTQALEYLEKAKVLAPYYSLIELNLGATKSRMNLDTEAEQHFRREIRMVPGDPAGHYVYGRWLEEKDRQPEAVQQLQLAIKANPDYLDALYVLMRIEAKRETWDSVQTLADSLLARFPKDEEARAYRLMAAPTESLKTPENYLKLSALHYLSGRFEDAAGAAKEALRLRPNYPEALNNLAASYRGSEKWELAIDAAQQALRLRPDYKPAKENLARAQEALDRK